MTATGTARAALAFNAIGGNANEKPGGESRADRKYSSNQSNASQLTRD